jgi:hypothetical protein
MYFEGAIQAVKTQLEEWDEYIKSIQEGNDNDNNEQELRETSMDISEIEDSLSHCSSHNTPSASSAAFKVIQKPKQLKESEVPQRFWPLIGLHRYKHLCGSSSTSTSSSTTTTASESHYYDNKKQGAKVVIFGSADPWAECLSLALGARSITTVQ